MICAQILAASSHARTGNILIPGNSVGDISVDGASFASALIHDPFDQVVTVKNSTID
jgi:hypothetical protein